MEGSFVKLKIAEKEERMKVDKEKKSSLKTINNGNNISAGGVQKDGKYYLVRLEMELEKLKSMINEAESDQRLSQIPEDACGKIRNAVGKAQLLITKKFKQFEELCRDNIEDNPEKRQNEMETKSSDLQGYWEMMFMQIDDVKALFNHIEKLKANNWAALEEAQESPHSSNNNSPKVKVKSSASNKSSPARPRKKTKNGMNDEKVKREAKSRIAAIRKQGKLRQQQSLDSDNFIVLEGTSNDQDISGLLNNNLPLDTSENGSLNSSATDDASLNSSLNSSLEGLYDTICTDNPPTPSMLTREG